MITLEELDGQSLALIIWAQDEAGEHDVRVFGGIARRDGAGIFFDRSPEDSGFRLLDEWLPRINAVSDELKDIVNGASYLLSLSMGDAPEDSEDLVKTGMLWGDGESGG